MSAESFHDGRVHLHAGDCRDVLAALPDESVHACVTDPPYHLASIVKRFGGERAAPAQFGTDGAYARAARGFMGKQWDGGDIAFQPETWWLVWRVLKPGAHLVAFAASRNAHRMFCAIEDAGFEVRDCLVWLYGSGFPKSHDVAKGIDKTLGATGKFGAAKTPEHERFLRGDTNAERVHEGWKRPWMDNPEAVANTGRQYHPGSTEAQDWQGWGTALKPAYEPCILARKPLSEKTIAANVLKHGTGALNIDACRVEVTGQRPYNVRSWEPAQLLCDSCAALAEPNVKHSTLETKASTATRPAEQTLNGKEKPNQPAIDKPDIGCSAGTTADDTSTNSSMSKSGRTPTGQSQQDSKSTIETKTEGTTTSAICSYCQKPITVGITDKSTRAQNSASLSMQSARGHDGDSAPKNRWPANIIHDGSDEVVGAFPESNGQQGDIRGTEASAPLGGDVYGHGLARRPVQKRGDEGSAARFFYSAKADANDRLGSKHPTVKPVDLMQWLCRLVTPPGGTILDPFSGTGTTGEAALREGFRAVLIEREAEYQADIRRRMSLVFAGPDERSHATVKASGKVEAAGPLFQEAAE